MHPQNSVCWQRTLVVVGCKDSLICLQGQEKWIEIFMFLTITHFYHLCLRFLIVSFPANRAHFIEVLLLLSLTRFNVCRTAQGQDRYYICLWLSVIIVYNLCSKVKWLYLSQRRKKWFLCLKVENAHFMRQGVSTLKSFERCFIMWGK